MEIYQKISLKNVGVKKEDQIKVLYSHDRGYGFGFNWCVCSLFYADASNQ